MGPPVTRTSNIIVFDLDGTLTERDTYLPFLLGFLVRHPWRFWRIMHLGFAVAIHLIGWRDNTWLKKVFLNAFMGGLSKQALSAWVDKFTHNILANGLRGGAIERLRLHLQEGDTVILASASLDIYVQPLGRALGFEHIICTQVAWDTKGCITGELRNSNCYGQEKVTQLSDWLRLHGYEGVNIAYTDHHSDLPLLNWAKNGIVVNPTPKLRIASQKQHLDVVVW